MDNILEDLSTPALVHAIEANQLSLFHLFNGWPRAESNIADDLTWVITDIPHPLFNFILGARLNPGDEDAAIRSAIERGKAHQVPLLWYTSPSTRPTNLGEHLVGHGFSFAGESPGMAIDLLAQKEDIPQPPGLTIARVSDQSMLERWCHVLGIGFEMPVFVEQAMFDVISYIGLGEAVPLIHYLGMLDGEPVAASSVLFGQGVAGIYNVTALPGVRRQGLGTAITCAPLREARARGYHVAILHASEIGESVYRRMGFQEYCQIRHYLWLEESER